MSGLLYKDLVLLWKSSKSFLLMAMVFVCVGLADTEMSYFWVFPCILAGNLSVTLLSLDERDKWLEYCCALPVSRRQVVTGKYLISFLVLLGMLVFMGLALVLRMAVTDTWNLDTMLLLLSVLLAAGLVMPGVMLPMMLKFGVEKGRLVYLACVGIMAAVVGALSGLEVKLNTSVSMLPLILTVVAGVIYGISWLVSVKLYERREL